MTPSVKDGSGSGTRVGSLAAFLWFLVLQSDAQEPTTSRATSEPTGDGAVVVTGRVVGSARLPVLGAQVTLHQPERDPVRGLTGPDGVFRLIIQVTNGGLQSAMVRAQSPDGRAASTGIGTRHGLDCCASRPAERTFNVGTLPLRPAARRSVIVISDGSPTAGIRVKLWRSSALFDSVVTNDAGIAAFEGVVADASQAWFTCEAESLDGRYANVPLDLSTPQQQPAVVVIRQRRRFLLRLMDDATQTPVTRAIVIVSVEEQPDEWHQLWAPVSSTDTAGQLRVDGPPGFDRLKLWIRAPGYEEQTNVRVPEGVTDATVMTVKLARKANPRRWLARDASPRLPDGTEIKIWSVDDVEMKDLILGRIENGELRVPWDREDGRLGLALAPDGTFADLQTSSEPVSFHKPRDVKVALKWDDGAPASGVCLQLDQVSPARPVLVVTDLKGEARASVRSLSRISCKWQTPDLPYHINQLDPAMTTTAGNWIRATLIRAVDVSLRIRLDGEQRLPDEFELTDQTAETLRIAEDPVTATLSFKYRPRWKWHRREPTIKGPAFAAASLLLSALPGAHISREVALHAGTTVITKIDRHAAPRVTVQQYEHGRERPWQLVRTAFLPRDTPSSESSVYFATGPLAPGTYRLVTTLGNDSAYSHPFALSRREQQLSLPWDLSQFVRVRGHVEGPVGLNLSAGVIVPLPTGTNGEPSADMIRQNGMPVKPNGSFDFIVAGVTSTRVAVRHPDATHVDAPVTVGAAAEPIVMKLAPPTHATRFTADIGLPAAFASVGSFRVLQFAGGDRSQPIAEGAAKLFAGRLQVCNLRPVVSTLFLDPPSHLQWTNEEGLAQSTPLPSRTPVVIEDVDLRGADHDLGSIAFPTGSTLELAFTGPWSRPTEPFRILVEALEAPRYRRTAWTTDPEARLSGLRRGTFRVVISQTDERAFEFETLVAADGVRPIALSVDSPTLEVK
jgi:hypothetical protein